MTRWDSPLFTVLDEDEVPPCDEIWEALVGSDGKAKVVRPNQATVLVCKQTTLENYSVNNAIETGDGAELPL